MTVERLGQRVGRRGPVDAGATEVNSVRVGERGGHPAMILLLHCSEDEAEVVERVPTEQVRQGLARGWVVCAIQDDERVGGHRFEAARPVCVAEPPLDIGRVDAGDLSSQRRRYSGVRRLMLAEQREIRFDVPSRTCDRNGAFDVRGHLAFPGDHVGVALADGDSLRLGPDRLERRPAGSRHERLSGRRYLRLVQRDRLDGVAEDIRMLETHARDGAGDWVHDARGVVLAADAYFEHCHIDVFTSEVPQREHGEHFEIRRTVPLTPQLRHARFDVFGERADALFGNFPAVDAYTLAQVVQVRRGVQSDVESGAP